MQNTPFQSLVKARKSRLSMAKPIINEPKSTNTTTNEPEQSEKPKKMAIKSKHVNKTAASNNTTLKVSKSHSPKSFTFNETAKSGFNSPNETFSPRSKRDKMNEYSIMNVVVPTVIRDKEYLQRKETIEAFLRKKDWDNMMAARSGEKKAIMVTKHTTIGQVKTLQGAYKAQQQIINLGKKKGVIYTNEFWSDKYYHYIINDSEMQKKVDGIKDLQYLNREQKLKLFENLYKKKALSNIKKQMGEIKELNEQLEATSKKKKTESITKLNDKSTTGADLLSTSDRQKDRKKSITGLSKSGTLQKKLRVIAAVNNSESKLKEMFRPDKVEIPSRRVSIRSPRSQANSPALKPDSIQQNSELKNPPPSESPGIKSPSQIKDDHEPTSPTTKYDIYSELQLLKHGQFNIKEKSKMSNSVHDLQLAGTGGLAQKIRFLSPRNSPQPPPSRVTTAGMDSYMKFVKPTSSFQSSLNSTQSTMIASKLKKVIGKQNSGFSDSGKKFNRTMASSFRTDRDIFGSLLEGTTTDNTGRPRPSAPKNVLKSTSQNFFMKEPNSTTTPQANSQIQNLRNNSIGLICDCIDHQERVKDLGDQINNGLKKIEHDSKKKIKGYFTYKLKKNEDGIIHYKKEYFNHLE